MGPGRALELGLLLGVLVGAASGLHSLRYFRVAVSEPSPGMPQFVAAGYLDGNPMGQYNSEVGRFVSRPDWVKEAVEPQFRDTLTQIEQKKQRVNLQDLDNLRLRYNESGTVQTLQYMIRCDLLEDNSTRGYWQVAYNGRDSIAFDLDMMTFTAADDGALITKRKWEEDGTVAEGFRYYLEDICFEWLRKTVSRGRAVLERKEPPTVRVSGKEAHGILTLSCRTYSFYPWPISVSWLKAGEVWDQETEWGSVAPNSDGTYYTWASIAARLEEKDKYRYRMEHTNLPEPGLFAWELEPESSLLAIVLGVVCAIVVVIAVVAGFSFWKMKQGNNEGYNVASRITT